MIVLDTSFLLALLDENDAGHQTAGSWYSQESGPFTTTPLVLAELDYLLHARATPAVAGAFYDEIRAGGLGVEWWLAGVLETNRIATFDERHFRAVEPLDGAPAFRLFPEDA